jgi:hypothetical protein
MEMEWRYSVKVGDLVMQLSHYGDRMLGSQGLVTKRDKDGAHAHVWFLPRHNQPYGNTLVCSMRWLEVISENSS